MFDKKQQRNVVEDSLRMRTMVYRAQVKAKLLTETIYQVELGKKKIDQKANLVNEENKKLLTQLEFDRILNEKNALLSQMTERYELTMDSINEGIWDRNLITGEVFFSKKWKEMLGYMDNELPNRVEEWMKRIHPDDLQQTLSDRDASLSGKFERYESIHRLKHKSGKWIWVRSRGKTFFDDEGNPERMLGTHTDITMQKEYEYQLLESTKSMKKAQRIAKLGSFIWDSKTNLLICSDELYRILDEVPGSFEANAAFFLKYIDKKSRKELMGEVQAIKKGVKNTLDLTCTLKKNNKWEKGFIRLFIEVVRSGKGELQNITGFIHDITKERLDEEKNKEILHMLEESIQSMNDAKNRAELATRSKSTFLANMSHEIRTPLNAINGILTLLKEDEKNPEKVQLFDTIDKASQTLLNTINDILDFSKVESGKMKISKCNFDVREEIYSSIEIFRPKAAEKSIDLGLSFSENLPGILYSDILRIKQVINNLLSNAIKFTQENGEINVRIEYDKHKMSVFVKDNGMGISDERQKRIFDAFEQGGGEVAKHFGGTGLGLSISSELIKLLNGELKLSSKEGQGSLLYFTIPIEEGSKVPVKRTEEVDPSIPLSGKILIVEDSPTSQMFMEMVMQKYAIPYDIANNGIEALEKYKSDQYDLIFMDENMPLMNGRDASKKIRELEKTNGSGPVPIVALTANALSGDREKFLKAGMDDYLSKPADPQKILHMMHKYLNRS